MPKTPHRGFVLLLVLVVLSIAAVLMTTAARRHSQDLLAAREAQRDLQVRWGMLSCRAAILPIADALIREAATDREPVAAERLCSVALGDMRFRMAVGDELAKANVNLLAARGDGTALSRAMARLQTAGGGRSAGLAVQLRPLPKRPASGDTFAIQYESFDQLFTAAHANDLFAGPSAPGDLARRRLTCWGGGLVNLNRADKAVLQEVLAPVLPPEAVTRLDEFRRSNGGCSIRQALASLRLGREQTDSAARLLTAASDTFSLFVAAEGRTRTWFRLYVQKGSGQSEDEPALAFAW